MLDWWRHPRSRAWAGCRICSGSGALLEGGGHSGGRPVVQHPLCALWVALLLPSRQPTRYAPQPPTLAVLGHQDGRQDMVHVALPRMSRLATPTLFWGGPSHQLWAAMQ